MACLHTITHRLTVMYDKQTNSNKFVITWKIYHGLSKHNTTQTDSDVWPVRIIKNLKIYHGLSKHNITMTDLGVSRTDQQQELSTSSMWVQLRSYLQRIVRRIGPLRMIGSDVSGSVVSHMTGSDASHVFCPEVCSAHAQPEVAQYPS